jgi:hypothetical protein
MMTSAPVVLVLPLAQQEEVMEEEEVTTLQLEPKSLLSEEEETLLSTKKKVQFSVVCLHEHPITMGDNMGGSHGVPVQIDWKAQDSFQLAVEEYESSRPERRYPRELVLPASTRFELLRTAGYSRGEITQQLKWARIERNRLRASVNRVRFQKLDECLDAMRRTLYRFVTLGIPKRRQRRYLEECAIYAQMINAGQREHLKPCLKNLSKASFDSTIRTTSMTEADD